MATINGITIKSYKTFSGIEYPTIREANVWKDGKKIGTYREDEWGGEGHFTNGLYNALKPSAIAFQSGCRDGWRKEYESSPESFICHVLDLCEYEKVYRKNLKNGFFTLYLCNDWKWMTYRLYRKADLTKLPQFMLDDIKREFPKGDHYLWQAVNDEPFNITVDADHPIPRYLDKKD